jgi:hypothetical protein
MELRAAPPTATVHYTTDGSDPKVAGAVYDDPFLIPHGCTLVLAYAECDGIESEVEYISVSWDREEPIKVDPRLPATLMQKQEFHTTKETYEFLERLKKHRANVVGLTITIGGESGVKEWIELTTHEKKRVAPQLLEECLEALRKLQGDGQVKTEAKALFFETGQDLLDWAETVKTVLEPGEIKQ